MGAVSLWENQTERRGQEPEFSKCSVKGRPAGATTIRRGKLGLDDSEWQKLLTELSNMDSDRTKISQTIGNRSFSLSLKERIENISQFFEDVNKVLTLLKSYERKLLDCEDRRCLQREHRRLSKILD
jgi:seryl-tRNA synthetase